MALKDYTTKIEPEQTIGEIQRLLKEFGVQSIITDFDNTGNVCSMSFFMMIKDRGVNFRMPTDWRPVLKAMERDRDVRRYMCTEDQARRTAWRQIYHWIDAQLALVRIHMVKIETIFLPYAVGPDGRTLWEMFDEKPQFLLGK